MPITLGLDIGTTSTIGILVDWEGSVLALAARATTLHSAHPGWAEEDPEEWWRNSCAVIGELLAVSGLPARSIAAVGVTGMLPALVLLDRDGRPLRRSIQQSDGRTHAEVQAMRRTVEEAPFLARTGQGITQQLLAPKLHWLQSHEPEATGRARTVQGAYDFIANRLTGTRSIEANWALEAGFLDLASGRVAPDLVALAGIEPDLLPPVYRASSVIGQVTAPAAALTGLAIGTPVVAGCADHIASAFVAGVVEPGDCLLKFGGAGDILLGTDAPRPDPRLFLDYHILESRFMPNGCMACSGSLLNWFVAQLGGGRSHAELDALAEPLPPGADGLLALPYFLGEKTPIQDPQAKGLFLGLGLHHEAGHLWRALLEAIAMGFRHHIDVARQIGHPVHRVMASDGGAKSRIWMQIVADTIGAPLTLLEGHPGSCLGAAFVAARGVTKIDPARLALFVSRGPTLEPRPRATSIHDEAYALYRQAYTALRPLQPALAHLAARGRSSRA